MGILNAIRDWINFNEYADKNSVKQNTLDISEPVYSFVKTFKENPKRFVLKLDYSGDYVKYTLTDRYEKLCWEFEIVYSYFMGQSQPSYILGDACWLTRDEVNYIYEAMEGYYIGRMNLLEQKKQQRRNRLHTKQRKALIEVYCK